MDDAIFFTVLDATAVFVLAGMAAIAVYAMFRGVKAIMDGEG